jgi:hypothetical protein
MGIRIAKDARVLPSQQWGNVHVTYIPPFAQVLINRRHVQNCINVAVDPDRLRCQLPRRVISSCALT